MRPNLVESDRAPAEQITPAGLACLARPRSSGVVLVVGRRIFDHPKVLARLQVVCHHVPEAGDRVGFTGNAGYVPKTGKHDAGRVHDLRPQGIHAS